MAQGQGGRVGRDAGLAAGEAHHAAGRDGSADGGVADIALAIQSIQACLCDSTLGWIPQKRPSRKGRWACGQPSSAAEHHSTLPRCGGSAPKAARCSRSPAFPTESRSSVSPGTARRCTTPPASQALLGPQAVHLLRAGGGRGGSSRQRAARGTGNSIARCRMGVEKPQAHPRAGNPNAAASFRGQADGTDARQRRRSAALMLPQSWQQRGREEAPHQCDTDIAV